MKTLMNICFGVIIGLISSGIIWILASRPRGNAVTIMPAPLPGVLTIYVSGAVSIPGVYILPEGSRVEAAVLAAGGFVPGAEQGNINLAALLDDGQQIDVPGIVNTSHINAGRVNINTATISELDALPGIGPSTAQMVIDYRQQNGPFLIVQDIQNVPGIGPATYSRIKDLITLEP